MFFTSWCSRSTRLPAANRHSITSIPSLYAHSTYIQQEAFLSIMTSSTFAFLIFLLSSKVLSSAFLVAPQSTQRHELSKIFMATWSDSRAVKEYQDFLSSGKQEIDQSADCPSVIITSNGGSSSELANALVAMGTGEDLVLTPDQDLPAFDEAYPVYIALDPSDIGPFLSNLKDSYRAKADDFVFFSGGLSFGNIEDVLKEKGMQSCRMLVTDTIPFSFSFF